MENETRKQRIGVHLPRMPRCMPYSSEDRLSHIKEPIESILCSGVFLRSPARVACYSDPAHLVYYTSKNRELRLNAMALNPDWTLNPSEIKDEILSQHDLGHFLRLIFNPMYRIAFKKYKEVNKK